MATREEILRQISRYLENYLKTEPFKSDRQITEDTLLYHDVGLRGIDAMDFIAFIVNNFEVDMSPFPFSKYFHGEYFGIADIIRLMLRRSDRSKAPLTVGEIVDACVAKHWPPRTDLGS